MENGLAVCAVFAHIRIFTGSFTSKTKTHADPYRINVRLQDRSGETRTRGLLLPKQARYQLRNTPASGGTAAPPKYSISFFVRFVNMESAVRGIGAFRLFHPIKAAVRKRAMTGIFCKKVRFWCNCRKADAKTGQHKICCALVASKPERCYHNTISPGSAAVGN